MNETISNWATTISSAVSAMALIVLVVQARRMAAQTRTLQQSIAAATSSTLYQQQQAISEFFFSNDHLRAYFYDGKELQDIDDASRVHAAAEMLLDFFEHIHIQKNALEPEVYDGWRQFMENMRDRSPVLRLFMQNNNSWYSKALMKELRPSGGH